MSGNAMASKTARRGLLSLLMPKPVVLGGRWLARASRLLLEGCDGWAVSVSKCASGLVAASSLSAERLA